MKFVVALLMLCCSVPAFAGVTGTGWETVCKVKTKVDRQGNYRTTVTYTVCKKEPTFNVFGFKLDAGVPDALGASFVGRPLKFAQAELGGTTTLVGGGIRAGASVFLPWYVSPSAHFEYGHQWAGNFNKLAVMFGAPNPNLSVLNHLEYDYINLHGGIGFGNPNWFMFRILAGYSYIWGATNGLQAYLQNKTSQPFLTASEAQVKAWTPSGKIVLQFYY